MLPKGWEKHFAAFVNQMHGCDIKIEVDEGFKELLVRHILIGESVWAAQIYQWVLNVDKDTLYSKYRYNLDDLTEKFADTFTFNKYEKNKSLYLHSENALKKQCLSEQSRKALLLVLPRGDYTEDDSKSQIAMFLLYLLKFLKRPNLKLDSLSTLFEGPEDETAKHLKSYLTAEARKELETVAQPIDS